LNDSRAVALGKFDPLAMALLGRNLRLALEEQDLVPFPPLEPFPGAGLYALYYRGDFDLYKGLDGGRRPIYVGKAEAGNSSYGDPSDELSPKLYKRIAEKHAASVREVETAGGNLRLADFEVRYLRLDDVWIVLGERALLRAYAPVLWNTVMPGFGANPPGTARRSARSVWDTIHPGRPRAGHLCNRRFTRSEMEGRVRRAVELSLMEPGPDRDEALKAFRAEKASMIWSPPKKGARDGRRLRVFRVSAFLAENRAIGAEIGDDEWVDTAGRVDDMLPDPEEATEANVRAAEAAEAGAASAYAVV
jgi:hypothetical protein